MVGKAGVAGEKRREMAMNKEEAKQRVAEMGSAVEFVTSLFDTELADSNEYDADVVSLVRTHLGKASIQSQAGVRLAADLVKLAQTRAKVVNQ